MMKRAVVSLLSLSLLLGAGCSHNRDLTRAASQQNFGVQSAKMNLWREALFRFQRAVEMNPNDAMAHNNLAVAYEAIGESEKARAAYVDALRLDKSNAYIQKNYSRYVEFLGRNKKRQQRAAAPRATAAPAGNVAPSAQAPPLTPSPQPPAAAAPGATPIPATQPATSTAPGEGGHR